jgi:hypothetical protein
MQNVEEKFVDSTHEWRGGSCLGVPALGGFTREVAPFSEFCPICHGLFGKHNIQKTQKYKHVSTLYKYIQILIEREKQRERERERERESMCVCVYVHLYACLYRDV